jgi:hypothetical protein
MQAQEDSREGGDVLFGFPPSLTISTQVASSATERSPGAQGLNVKFQ